MNDVFTDLMVFAFLFFEIIIAAFCLVFSDKGGSDDNMNDINYYCMHCVCVEIDEDDEPCKQCIKKFKNDREKPINFIEDITNRRKHPNDDNS